ncbi:MAG: hypothetical protein DRG78_08185 [Epsilonproteobacteria bacterium]|nr:MAG: hypothetical protein DRG78_08185 [Campylobacterota bacterium]
MIRNILISVLLVIGFSACSDTNKEPKGSASSGMKCGAGKCGANMFDGKSALAKKKKNMLSQMREDDPRKDCVISAKTTKEVYNCVRSLETKKMTLKCGAGKCGSKNEQAKMPAMKCGTGKCGSVM